MFRQQQLRNRHQPQVPDLRLRWTVGWSRHLPEHDDSGSVQGARQLLEQHQQEPQRLSDRHAGVPECGWC
jgi:hypothetical protein